MFLFSSFYWNLDQGLGVIMGGGDGDRVKVSTKQGIFFLGGGLVDKWRAWQK